MESNPLAWLGFYSRFFFIFFFFFSCNRSNADSCMYSRLPLYKCVCVRVFILSLALFLCHWYFHTDKRDTWTSVLISKGLRRERECQYHSLILLICDMLLAKYLSVVVQTKHAYTLRPYPMSHSDMYHTQTQTSYTYIYPRIRIILPHHKILDKMLAFVQIKQKNIERNRTKLTN